MLLLFAFQPILSAQGEITASSQLVDARGTGGQLFLDSRNIPHIFYLHETQDVRDPPSPLYYAVWTGQNWSINVVKEASGNKLLVDSNNKPHLINIINGSFEDYPLIGDNWEIANLGLSPVSGKTLALDSNGKLYQLYANYTHINSTYTSTVSVAIWTKSGMTHEKVDEKISNSPLETLTPDSLVLDSMGRPHVTYTETALNTIEGNQQTFTVNNIKYAILIGQNWITQTAATNMVSLYPRMSDTVLDSQGLPHLCFVYDNSTYLPDGYSTDRRVLEYLYWNGFSWIQQVVNPEAQYITSMNPVVHLDSLGKPQIYYYNQNYQDENKSGLMVAYWTGAAWENQKIWQLPHNDYGSQSQYISNLEFDSNGNLYFTYRSAMGTYHSALRYGNLTYVSLEAPNFIEVPSTQIVLPVLIIFTAILLVVCVLGRKRLLSKKR